MTKVSVVVPNYNHSNYLQRRLESIFDQTFQDFEIIFLDDASTDNSVQLFRNLTKGHAVTEILNDTNSGSPFIQWNRGVTKATGEYLWFAESDDWADKNLLSELVNVLDSNPGVGIAYCQSNFIDEQDQVIGSNLEFTKDLVNPLLWNNDFIMDGKTFCQKYELFKNPVHNASSALIRKSIWDKVGPADEGMIRCGDWMQVVKLLEVSDIGFVSRHMNYYRNNPATWKPDYPQIFKIKLEEYQILSYIKSHFNVPTDAADRRASQLCREWVGRVIYNSNCSEYEKFKNVYKYYKLYNRFDNSMETRILKNLTIEYSRKIHNKCISLYGKSKEPGN